MKDGLVADGGHARNPRTRLTRNDQVVLACLEDYGAPMKAYALLEEVRKDGINAPMTVYRALTRLTGQGRVKKIESLNAYYALPRRDDAGVAGFVICETCEQVGIHWFSDDDLRALVPGVPITDASIELKTSCAAALGDGLEERCKAAR